MVRSFPGLRAITLGLLMLLGARVGSAADEPFREFVVPEQVDFVRAVHRGDALHVVYAKEKRAFYGRGTAATRCAPRSSPPAASASIQALAMLDGACVCGLPATRSCPHAWVAAVAALFGGRHHCRGRAGAGPHLTFAPSFSRRAISATCRPW